MQPILDEFFKIAEDSLNDTKTLHRHSVQTVKKTYPLLETRRAFERDVEE